MPQLRIEVACVQQMVAMQQAGVVAAPAAFLACCHCASLGRDALLALPTTMFLVQAPANPAWLRFVTIVMPHFMTWELRGTLVTIIDIQ